MFDCIKNPVTLATGGTVTLISSDDVQGSISFHAGADRTVIYSSYGPTSAVREGVLTHWVSNQKNRLRALADDAVTDYS